MRREPHKEHLEMSNVAAVTGALIAGIVGGSLFAVGLVARPQTVQSPVAAPAGPVPGAIMTSPSGAAMVIPPGYGPGVMMTSGEAPSTTARQSAEGLAPLAQP